MDGETGGAMTPLQAFFALTEKGSYPSDSDYYEAENGRMTFLKGLSESELKAVLDGTQKRDDVRDLAARQLSGIPSVLGNPVAANRTTTNHNLHQEFPLVSSFLGGTLARDYPWWNGLPVYLKGASESEAEPSIYDARNAQQEKGEWKPYPWTPAGESPWILPEYVGMQKNEVLRKMVDNMKNDRDAMRKERQWKFVAKGDPCNFPWQEAAEAAWANCQDLLKERGSWRDLAVSQEQRADALEVEVDSLKARLAALEQPAEVEDGPSPIHDALKVMARDNHQLTARAGWHK